MPVKYGILIYVSHCHTWGLACSQAEQQGGQGQGHHHIHQFTSIQDKYLGDLTSNRTFRNTIEERENKGFGIVNEIIAILDDIPLRNYKMEI